MKEKIQKETQEIVFIKWNDTVRNNRWHTLEETKRWCRDNNWIVYDTGFLVEDTKEYIYGE